MKENKLKVSFFTQAKRADKKGMVPLIGRIELGRKHSAFSDKKKVPLSLWDSRKQRLLGKSAIANSINRYLNECTALIHARYRELCESGESFTATDVRNAYQGQLCQNAYCGNSPNRRKLQSGGETSALYYKRKGHTKPPP